MTCPICGMGMADGMTICKNCGYNMANNLNVSPDKVIAGQTPEEQAMLGDDSVTQLIPENYLAQKGDDTKTVLINQDQASQYMPNVNTAPKFVNNTPAYNNQVAPVKQKSLVPVLATVLGLLVVAVVVLIVVLCM